MNRWIGTGRLTADPEIRSTQDGKKVGRFTLAVDRRVARNAQGHTDADFIPVTVWEKRAEFAEKYLHKGTKIAVVGRIQTGSYTSREGQKVYTTDIVAEELEFCESKKEESKPEEPPMATADNFVPAGDIDEELPFN